jgi:hypothetical protein
MLDADAEVAIVDLSQLAEPNRERATAIFSADEVVRLLGGICFFSGIDARWKAAIADAHVAIEATQLVEDFAAALAAARRMENRTEQPRRTAWRSWLDRWRR